MGESRSTGFRPCRCRTPTERRHEMAFLAAAAPVLGTIGTLVGVGGQVASGLYAGQVAKNNAQVAGQNASYALEAGTADAATQSLKGAAKVGQIKTSMAANGIDINSGSAPNVVASQEGADELDIENILHNSNLQAYGYRTQPTDFEAQGEQDVGGGVAGGVQTFGGRGATA